MKKLLILMLVLSIGLAVGCGKSEKPDSPAKKEPGQEGTESEEIDVDKLDIPDRLKEAIKSGMIPKEQVAAMLKQMQGGGDAPLVNVERVSKKDLNSYLVLNGVVEPERTIEIHSRLSAYVKEILKEEGAFVKKNDILALLDDTEIRIGYQQANIQLEQARLTYEEAKTTLERSQELMKKELISQQEMLAAENQFNQRKLDYDNRQEAFKNLQLQLNWTEIRSLAEGYITERLIEVGTKVNANQQVYTIEDFSPLLIRVYAPSADSINLTPGMTAEISTDNIKGTIFDGKVKLINPRIDVQSGTVKVTVETHDDSLRMKPGMFVEVRIVIGQKNDILVIPRKSVLYKQNKTFVFVLNQMKVAQREVTLGLLEEDMVEIIDGLEEGDTIVVVGIESLKDGQSVKVVQ
jgi:membrane fusion protein (multidrug efflux system)